jgi:hypothetical protein
VPESRVLKITEANRQRQTDLQMTYAKKDAKKAAVQAKDKGADGAAVKPKRPRDPTVDRVRPHVCVV